MGHLSNLQRPGLEFDVEAAILVCREAGYYEYSLDLAKVPLLSSRAREGVSEERKDERARACDELYTETLTR